MIRVKPNKTKTFYFVYSFTGKYKKMSLGEYPTLSLTFAREMVKEYKGLIYRNIDPLAYRKTLQNPVEEKQLTFSEMAEKWRDRRAESGQCKPFPSQRHFNHATCQFSPLFHEKHLTPIFHQPPERNVEEVYFSTSLDFLLENHRHAVYIDGLEVPE